MKIIWLRSDLAEACRWADRVSVKGSRVPHRWQSFTDKTAKAISLPCVRPWRSMRIGARDASLRARWDGRELAQNPTGAGVASDPPPRSSAEPGRTLFRPPPKRRQMLVGAGPRPTRYLDPGRESLPKARHKEGLLFCLRTGGRSLTAPLLSAPLRREHRLYQADWLFRFYGFRPPVLPGDDPACPSLIPRPPGPFGTWPFPVDVMSADTKPCSGFQA